MELREISRERLWEQYAPQKPVNGILQDPCEKLQEKPVVIQKIFKLLESWKNIGRKSKEPLGKIQEDILRNMS